MKGAEPRTVGCPINATPARRSAGLWIGHQVMGTVTHNPISNNHQQGRLLLPGGVIMPVPYLLASDT